MDERLQFVARRLAGEPMAELCREFGIPCKTGFKIFTCPQQCRVEDWPTGADAGPIFLIIQGVREENPAL